jgi:hypothetical protein
MDKIRLVHDTKGQTLTVWLDDPEKEHTCEETTDEVILMKDPQGRIIGFELLHYRPTQPQAGFSVETIVRTWSFDVRHHRLDLLLRSRSLAALPGLLPHPFGINVARSRRRSLEPSSLMASTR